MGGQGAGAGVSRPVRAKGSVALQRLDLQLTTNGGLLLLRPAFDTPGFSFAFSTRVQLRPQGPRFCDFGTRGNAAAMRARRALLHALDLPAQAFTLGNQEHTANAAVVDRESAGAGGLDPATRIPATDALATVLPRTPLGALTADCVPILLADPRSRTVAAIHAGWRGAAAGVAHNTVQAMRALSGAKPRDILAFLGPHIGPCCYEVGAEVARQVSETRAIAPHGKKFMLNLAVWNASLLRSAGLLKKNIFASDYCTACRTDLFHSYRADKKVRGSNVSLIWLTQ